jgi:hypothetical protein
MFLSVTPRFAALDKSYLSEITAIGDALATNGSYGKASKDCFDLSATADKKFFEVITKTNRDQPSLDAKQISGLIKPIILPILNLCEQFKEKEATLQLIKKQYQGTLVKLLAKMSYYKDIGEDNMSAVMDGFNQYIQENASHLDPWLLDAENKTFKDTFMKIKTGWASFFPKDGK